MLAFLVSYIASTTMGCDYRLNYMRTYITSDPRNYVYPSTIWRIKTMGNSSNNKTVVEDKNPNLRFGFNRT